MPLSMMPRSIQAPTLGPVIILTLLLGATFAAAQAPELDPAPDPRTLGWSPEGLEALRTEAAEHLTHSYLLIHRSGQLIAEYGDNQEALQVFSVRKSLVSALLGVLAAEERLDLEATLAELDLDDVEGLTDAERQATVLDLLAARSGVYHPAAYETPGMMKNRPERGAFEPGEHYFYNNWDFNALNTIAERAGGAPIGELFASRIGQAIGMEDFGPEDVEQILEPVSSHPAAEFWLSGRDLARFGLLFLERGRWGDRQVVPTDWVDESTRVHSELGILGGYGLSWWVASRQEHFPFVQIPDGVFSARGTGEQTVLVLPHLDAVWVHRTRVTSPDQEMMHVTDTGRLVRALLAAYVGD